jgi:parallel beta-helix repeat protein
MRRIIVSEILGFAALALLAGCKPAETNVITVTAGPAFQKEAQEALIRAKPGNVVMLPAGKLQLDGTLSLTAPGVTIRGAGIDKTTLSFAGQKTGSAGLLATADKFTLEDLAIEDTKGDALKVNNADGVTIRRVRVEWTGGPKETNGSYGFYPVQCKNVLIEDSAVIGASDAGIYVGQSSNIVVRRNRAEKNVAGIEIENSQHADVYENTATGNTGGILVFNLPDLPVKDGQYTRVYKNNIVDNNLANFAPKGNMVAKVPAGTGLMVLATKQVEAFNNTIKGNGDASVSIISYQSTGNPMKDASYYPWIEAIHIHDNTISGGGTAPNGNIGGEIAKVVGKPLPDILYDGMFNPEKLVEKKIPDALRVCLQNNAAQNNTSATFANFDAAGGFKKVSRDLAPYNCALPPLEAVVLH